MLCCVGLIGGMAVGQSLGGHWTYTAPAIGFGLGLYGDMKFMHRMHGHGSPDSNSKNKMSCCSPSSKEKKSEKPLLQRSLSDTDAKTVQRDSG
jgi:hypothetical protein